MKLGKRQVDAVKEADNKKQDEGGIPDSWRLDWMTSKRQKKVREDSDDGYESEDLSEKEFRRFMAAGKPDNFKVSLDLKNERETSAQYHNRIVKEGI